MRCAARTLHVSVDFEAFDASRIDCWDVAMEHWAQVSQKLEIPCSFFVSVEDAVKVRADDTRAYGRLTSRLRELIDAGSSLHPHNHRVFDLRTGEQRTPPGVPKHVPGYARQASFFYDVHHRHGTSMAEWFPELMESYRSLCEDIGDGPPKRVAFRPGGWDCGSTAEEQSTYLAAVSAAGVTLHSGDSHGYYGTWKYRVNTRFGDNVYPLAGGLLELAPCWALNCGAAPGSPPFLGSMARLVASPVSHGTSRSGAFVIVLHFDHLFHTGWRSSLSEFSVRSADEIRSRIDRALGLIARVGTVLNLRPTRLEDAPLPPPVELAKGSTNGRPHSLSPESSACSNQR